MFVWLRRAFDLVCALAGLALLVLLGPWMLLTGATAHVPAADELVRLSGTTAACRPVFGGVRLLLAGYDNEFQAQLDSCIEAQVELAQPVHVLLNVVPADLHAAQPRKVIPSFGFEVEGRVVHTLRSDLRTAHLDRAVITATGILGTAVLLWLAWAVGTSRASLVHLLMGE